MSRVSRSLRILTLAGTALAGLVGGHVLDYLLMVPDAASRHAMLADTGHGYLSLAIRLAVASAIVAAVSSAALGVRRSSGHPDEPVAFRAVAWRLVQLLPAAFLLLEMGERIAAGVPAHHLLDPVIVAGVLLQGVVAIVGAAILVALARGGELVGKALARSRHLERAASNWSLPLRLVLTGQRLSGPVPIRAPPSLLAPQH